MRRYKIVLLVLLVVGAIFVVYQQHTAPYQRCEGQIFGTYYHITYQHATDLSAEILYALHSVDSSLSMFNASSTLSRINRNETTTLDKALLYLLPRAQQVAAATEGAFDITVAPLVNAWGFGFQSEEWPSATTIDSLRAFVGYDKISVKGQQLVKSDPRIMLDLSAIAKGYGADVVAQVLDNNKVRNYMVELGGDLVVKGKNSNGAAWRIGISQPKEPPAPQQQEEYQCVINVSDVAMATSGNYRNFFYKDGVRYAHTIDPHTGYPIQQDILSATILAPHCYEADAYATAAMVMGLRKMQDLLQQQKNIEAYLIYTTATGDEAVWMTEGFEKHLP